MSRAAYRKQPPAAVLVNTPPERSPAPILLSVKAAADALDLAYDTVLRHVKEGKIPTVTINKRRWVVVTSLDAWLRHTQPGQQS
jgi:hypothetical protein